MDRSAGSLNRTDLLDQRGRPLNSCPPSLRKRIRLGRILCIQVDVASRMRRTLENDWSSWPQTGSDPSDLLLLALPSGILSKVEEGFRGW